MGKRITLEVHITVRGKTKEYFERMGWDEIEEELRMAICSWMGIRGVHDTYKCRDNDVEVRVYGEYYG